jgi:hypothetical protein
MDRAGLLAAVQALRAGETGPSALMKALALGQAAARPPQGEGSMPVQFFLLTDAAFPLEASAAAASG